MDTRIIQILLLHVVIFLHGLINLASASTNYHDYEELRRWSG